MMTENMIFDNLYTTLKTQFSDLYITSSYEPTPKRLPCVFAYESLTSQRARNISLDDYNNHRISTFTVEIYAAKDGGKVALQNIAEAVKAVFADMYYILQTENTPPNADLSVIRKVLRFRRIIGGGDTIKETENEEVSVL